MKNIKQLAWIVPLLILASSCEREEQKPMVQALIPVYESESAEYFKLSAARPLTSIGKIYIKDQYLFINEKLTGVHVYDNTDPSNPKTVGFIDIPGNIDIAIKGSALYADIATGLVTLDITDLQNIELKDYNEAHATWSEKHPPSHLALEERTERLYYQCVNPDKGKIMTWKRAYIEKPECYINGDF